MREVYQALIDGSPSIHLDPLRDRIQVNTHWLSAADIEHIVRRLTEELNARH